MKKITYLLFVSVCAIFLFSNCTTCHEKKEGMASNVDSKDNKADLPLNISVYLDLSDRLTRELSPSQMERDTAIINHLVDLFINDCITRGKIINSKNHFQIFFYPTPNISEVAQLAKGLNVDLAKTELKQKKVELMEMKTNFQKNLTQIYDETIAQKRWVGSDIWGFFSNGIVDKLCIRKGYRNILVILTDGYLYHEDNKVVDGKAYSYVLPQTLSIEGSSLILKHKGLTDLEVLMLEVNPYTPKQHDALISVLENWFKGMEIEKFVVSETALPVNTEVYIDSFIND
ncbi:hypothetical protein [uncultured Duncaniella sp.]|uniref:hypothetical protein n=2 Tax=uncultured Duncaniella sp. TaxID=2768039 RepID=UPI002620838B|nr:hypothetical protein [uncultured Duncaniella sp.]